MSIEIRISKNVGRSYGLYNEKIREILFFVGTSEEKESIGDIAKAIRNTNVKKMSNEYKIIKRLYLDIRHFLDKDKSDIEKFTDKDKSTWKGYLYYSEIQCNGKNEKNFFSIF